MERFESTRANKRRADNKRHWVIGVALTIGAYLFGIAALESSASAHSGTQVISGDSKKADKEAKKAEKAEKAAARAAKKKAKKADDDGSLAKAKTGKGGSKAGSSVDLGDDDPLEGL